MKNWLVLILLLSSQAMATELSLSAQLRRASLLIRGQNPTTKEFARVNGSYGEGAYRDLVRSYVESDEFKKRMKFQLTELFRLRINRLDEMHADEGVFIDVIEQTLAGNRSWDHLFLADRFSYDPSQSPSRRLFQSIGEPSEFYPAEFVKFKPVQYQTPWLNKFFSWRSSGAIEVDGQGSPIFAGVLTSPEFFDRYADNINNVSRGRSAALYRILLCDAMSPAVQINAANDLKVLSDVFGDTKAANPHAKPAKNVDAHATDPVCSSCHNRIDPPTPGYRQNGSVLGANAVQGVFNVINEKGQRQQVSGRGMGGMMRELVKTNAYQECQVRHFWKWYVGEDIPLTGEKLREWVKVFNQVQRRPREFVQKLVTSTDFKMDLSLKQGQFISLPHVAGILRRCSECHAMEGAARLDVDLIEGSKSEHFVVLKRMARFLDFKNSGAKPQMPPPEQEWQLSNQEKALLFNWLNQGARDSSGSPTLTPEQVAELSPPAKMPEMVYGRPTFGFNFHRIFDAQMMQNLQAKNHREPGCQMSSFDDYKPYLRRPKSGQYPSPNVSTEVLERSEKCAVAHYKNLERTVLSEETKMKATSDAWDLLEPETKKMMARELLHHLIGPNSVANEELLLNALIRRADNLDGEKNYLTVLEQMSSWIGAGVKELISI